MKNINYLVLSLISLIIPINLYAVSISAGANVWYAWYEPSFKNEMIQKDDIWVTDRKFEMTENANFIYGVILGVQFTENISIGGVFSYGTGWKCKANYIDSGAIYFFRYLDKIERFEGDLTINYRFNDVFKLFFGWKYCAQKGDGGYYYYTSTSPDTVYSGSYSSKTDSNGPGAGFTFKVSPFVNT